MAGDVDSFVELVLATREKQADLFALDIRTRHEDAHWPWWSYAEGLLPCPARAFQPLCRLSGRLVRAVLDFQKRHRRLTFNEVLFTSLVHEHGMTWLDWRRDETADKVLKNFRYRPNVNQVGRGVSHPVKDPGLHESICRLPPVVAGGRRSQAVCEEWSIFPKERDGRRTGATVKFRGVSSFTPIHLPEAGLSIFTIPKNGGTTLWAWVYLLQTKSEHLPGNVYSQTWLRKGPLQKQKLIVRRDPVERFISAYRNFRDKRGLKLGFDDFFEQFPHRYQTDGDIYQHFRPQSGFYPNMPLESFDHIVDFEHFHEAKSLIEQLSGEQVPDIHYQRAKFCDFEVHEWQAETIARFYQCDYDSGFGIPDAWRRDLT